MASGRRQPPGNVTGKLTLAARLHVIMQLAILTAVLAAIASADSGTSAVPDVAWRLLLVVSAALIAPITAFVGMQRVAVTVADVDEREETIWKLQTLVAAAWLLGVAIILLVAQWPRIVRGNWRLGDLPLIDELAILTPVIGSLVLVWAANYRLERSRTASNGALMQYLWLQARHQLGLVLLPPLAIVGLLETLDALKLAVLNINTVWWLAAPLVATSAICLPLAVRRIWPTSPLAPGDLRELIVQICRERNCRICEILIWQTGGTMANAAVIGFSRYLRYLLITDVLLARLTREQMAAVVRHEMAHLRRWHLPLRLAVLLLPATWWLAIQTAAPGISTTIVATLTSLHIPANFATAFGLPLGMLAYAIVAVGSYSRLLEHDADLDACLNSDGRLDPLAIIDLSSALLSICGRGPENRFRQWLHPPVSRRVEFLRLAFAEPRRAASFRRRFWWIAAAIVGLHVAAGLLAFAA
jgi:Zn-dependent protease with chaperone function